MAVLLVGAVPAVILAVAEEGDGDALVPRLAAQHLDPGVRTPLRLGAELGSLV